MLIDGKALATKTEQQILQHINQKQLDVCLAVVLVGDNPASQIYVRNKSAACQRVGIKNLTIVLDKDITQQGLEEQLQSLVDDPNVNGILLQLPLPKHLDEKRALAVIPCSKDVDGLTEDNLGKLFVGTPCICPCTPSGIIKLLQTVVDDFCGKEAVVIGRSNLVGKPLCQMLLAKDCSVTNLHSKSKNLLQHVKQADIVVCAVGKKELLHLDDFAKGAVVIDVGMNRDGQGKLCGDVQKGDRQDIFVTPVPGGVGPMTIAMLLENTLKCYYLQKGEDYGMQIQKS